MGPLLEVSSLSVRFETDDGPVQAVDRVSFDLAAGEVLGIVGESGCGKSVTCLALTRLLPSSARIEGRALLGGDDLLALGSRRLQEVRGRDIAYVFQDPATSLNPALTVGSQIVEVLRQHLDLPRASAQARAIELLRLVRIPAPKQRLDQYPHQLSGGMRQRVMIAIAIACDPKVVVADEPTTALDVTTQAAVLDLMRDIRERLGTAIVLITHNLGVVADIADRVVVMYAGQKVEEASVEDLFANPQHPYTIGLMAATPRASKNGRVRLKEIPGRVPALREPITSCAFLDRCPRADDQICRQVPPLVAPRAGHLVACFHPGPQPA
jgi:peptide/nickel transport system ATP-binding protein